MAALQAGARDLGLSPAAAGLVGGGGFDLIQVRCRSHSAAVKPIVMMSPAWFGSHFSCAVDAWPLADMHLLLCTCPGCIAICQLDLHRRLKSKLVSYAGSMCGSGVRS